MTAKTMWMVRSPGGQLADDLIEHRVVALGWEGIGDLNTYPKKAAIASSLRKQYTDSPDGAIRSSSSQLFRFRHELKPDDRVITYDTSKRIYHVGTISGEYQYRQGLFDGLDQTWPVHWDGAVARDDLTLAAKNRLGSTLTLFKVPEFVAREIEQLLTGAPVRVTTPPDEEEAEDSEESLLERYREEAFEIIKDRVNRLGWDEMEKLVAACLRAMGYKTRITPVGPDRGVDVMASPDGFGFESPRIVVEVKHRSGAIGAQQVRSFLGGRHPDDKGLYVSTGGFTKDARYEADRASIPLTLLDLGGLVEALLLHYEELDIEGRNLLPLKKLYWPV